MKYVYKTQGEVDRKLFDALSNEDLIKKLKSCKTPEDCYEATKVYVSDISFEEYTEAMQQIKMNMEESKDGLLSEADMMQVAGGCHTCEIVTAGAAVVGAAATAAGAAA